VWCQFALKGLGLSMGVFVVAVPTLHKGGDRVRCTTAVQAALRALYLGRYKDPNQGPLNALLP
jgi:hypothetical protein